MTLVDETELKAAKAQLQARGKTPEDFSFSVTHLPPDPDAVAMFTSRYVVTVTRNSNGQSLDLLGGIGLDWVSNFDEALAEGAFD